MRNIELTEKQVNTNFQGKVIASVVVGDQHLKLNFQDGSSLTAEDTFQLCCERRYMSAEDDLADFQGGKFYGLKISDARYIEGYSNCGNEHEIKFLRIETDHGPLVVCAHNEHNGCYGGFYLKFFADNLRSFTF